MDPLPFSCRRTTATFMSPTVVTASLVQVPCVIILHRLHLPVHDSPWRGVRGHQTHNALVLPPASIVAARPLCEKRVFLARSSRRYSFRRCFISTFHVEGCFCSSTLTIDSSRPSRRGLLFLVDAPGRLISTFPSDDSSRLVYRHVQFHLT